MNIETTALEVIVVEEEPGEGSGQGEEGNRRHIAYKEKAAIVTIGTGILFGKGNVFLLSSSPLLFLPSFLPPSLPFFLP
jgi:hypothetical protein